MKKVDFVTLTYARSGSSFFQRLLTSHPDISAAQEMLAGPIHKNRNVTRALERFYRSKRPKVLGFKLMYNHIDDEVWDFIRKKKLKIIQLIRANMLETVLWLPWCIKKGRIDGGMGPPMIVRSKVEVKIDVVIHWLKWLNEQIKKYRKEADYTVWYSQVTGNQDGVKFYDDRVRQDLLKFLGVRDYGLRCHQNRKNKREPSEKLIVNYSNLMKFIKKHRIKIKYIE